MLDRFTSSAFTEQFVQLDLGNQKIFACETVPNNDEKKETGILFIPGGFRGTYGPGRSFVNLSRLLAPEGFYSLRTEWLGSANSDGNEIDTMNKDLALETVKKSVFHMTTRDHVNRVTIVGLCWGAQIGVAAYHLFDAVNSVVAWSPPFECLPKSTFLSRKKKKGKLLFIFGEGDPIMNHSIVEYRKTCAENNIEADFVLIKEIGHTFASVPAMLNLEKSTQNFLLSEI